MQNFRSYNFQLKSDPLKKYLHGKKFKMVIRTPITFTIRIIATGLNTS